MIPELEGPFKEARLWLLEYLQHAKFKNDLLAMALSVDWSDYSKVRSGYVLGVIWGRLRQMDNSLEQATEYAELVSLEIDDDN